MIATLTAERSSGRFGLWALLFVLAGGMLIDALEVSVVLVALPAMKADLSLTLWQVQWVMGGFALGFGVFLLLGPRIADRWGRRRMYLAALLVFSIASLIGAMTDSALILVASRMVKGACAALTAPTGLVIISTAFQEGQDQRRAVSIYSWFGAAGFTVGLLCSGLLTPLSWRWVIVLAAPFALVLLAFASVLIPSDPSRSAESARPGASDGSSAVTSRLSLLTNGTLSRSAAGAAILNGTYLGLLICTVVSLQTEHGWSPWACAVAFLPACGPLALSALFTARLVNRYGTDKLIAVGALAAAAGYLLRVTPSTPDDYVAGILPTLLLVGLAFVLSFGALNIQALTEVNAGDRSVAVSLYQCGVQFGAVVMLSLVTVLLTVSDDDTAALSLIALVGVLGVVVAAFGVRATRQSRRRKEILV